MRKGVKMKIYTQDRKQIIEMPREIWVVEIGDSGGIFSTSYSSAELGTYGTVKRAKEVLEEIFQCCKAGSSSYAMPEQ